MKHDTHCTGDWVGPRAGLDGCGKSRPHRKSMLGPSKPVASRYTDWAILAHDKLGVITFTFSIIIISIIIIITYLLTYLLHGAKTFLKS